MKDIKIAIVILNWNGKSLLEHFLPSVVAYSKEADIYVADNASTDGSIDFIRSQYPSIKIIENAKNEGYAKGYNDVLKYVNADIFCLLNSDVEVTKNWLLPIIKAFKEEPNTAIIQPKLLDYNRKDYFEYAGAAGGFIDKFGYPYCRGRIFNTLEKDRAQYNDITNIFWASGACLFVRSTIFKALGGFDERFFAHFEEIDFCWRAKNLGHSITYVGHSTIYHIGGATLSNSNPRKTFLNFRNSLMAITKNAKGNLFLIITIRLIFDVFVGIKFISDLKFKHFLAVIKAHIGYYGYLPQLLNERKSYKNKIKYYQKTSVVIDCFVNKKTSFKDL